MLKRLKKQPHPKLGNPDIPPRFDGVLTPNEYREMMEFGMVPPTARRSSEESETVPEIPRTRQGDTLNANGTYDQPTFMRRGKSWPDLESQEVSMVSPMRPGMVRSRPAEENKCQL